MSSESSESSVSSAPRLVGLAAVYNASGTVFGEVSYWLRARVGLTHCSLCEITHGLFVERADWRRCRERLPVTLQTFHTNDQPPAVRDALGGSAPGVVAILDDGVHVVILDAAAIEALGGSPDALVEAIVAAVSRFSPGVSAAR